jgi:hypothetical protein
MASVLRSGRCPAPSLELRPGRPETRTPGHYPGVRELPNKEMKLTSVERIGRSQFIAGVRRTPKWERSDMVSFRAAVGLVLLACILVWVSNARAEDGEKRQAGFYLVAAEAESTAALPAAGGEQRVVRYDYKYLRDAERAQPLYLLLPKTADVQLVLAKAPELQEKGENGFPELRLELTPEAASKLEKLTREHLGGRVAFVIDGEPVTLHKIRSVITGGQFRLSRCTDTACQYIYGRLVGKP